MMLLDDILLDYMLLDDILLDYILIDYILLDYILSYSPPTFNITVKH